MFHTALEGTIIYPFRQVETDSLTASFPSRHSDPSMQIFFSLHSLLHLYHNIFASIFYHPPKWLPLTILLALALSNYSLVCRHNAILNSNLIFLSPFLEMFHWLFLVPRMKTNIPDRDTKKCTISPYSSCTIFLVTVFSRAIFPPPQGYFK